MLHGLDLFSGIGGVTLALSGYIKPIAYCEVDRYSQALLLSRMRTGQLPVAPIWDDVCTLSGRDISCPLDIVTGGFPCQDISSAGRGAGLDGKRSSLFWQLFRIVAETKPSFVFLENVPAIRTRGLKEVVRAFTDVGYDCRWTCVSAADVGAPHLRKRWFMLAANTNGIDIRQKQVATRRKGSTIIGHHGTSRNVADTEGHGCGPSECVVTYPIQRIDGPEIAKERSRQNTHSEWRPTDWSIEPAVGRVANGISNRVDRIKGLGNAVVPAQARKAFEILMGYA